MHTISALFNAFTQDTRLLQLSTPLGADKLIAECVKGEEGISQGYWFTVSALSTDAAIPLKSLLGQPALLELQTARSGIRRPFHGHLTRVEFNGADGGMARYTVTIEPWTIFLGRGRDSRVFQNMSVFDILDSVLSAYRRIHPLAPVWRYEVAHRSDYPVRSLTTQYRESDLAFVQRLMSEEGLFYFFEHRGDSTSPALGSHEMVIADYNGAFRPNSQDLVRFAGSSAVMTEDGMDKWRCTARAGANAVELQSWDYRACSSRPVSAYGDQAASADLVTRDALGAYAYGSTDDGRRLADWLLR